VVIDAGCGTSTIAFDLARTGWGDVTGIDRDAAVVTAMQARHPTSTARYLTADLAEYGNTDVAALCIPTIIDSSGAWSGPATPATEATALAGLAPADVVLDKGTLDYILVERGGDGAAALLRAAWRLLRKDGTGRFIVVSLYPPDLILPLLTGGPAGELFTPVSVCSAPKPGASRGSATKAAAAAAAAAASGAAAAVSARADTPNSAFDAAAARAATEDIEATGLKEHFSAKTGPLGASTIAGVIPAIPVVPPAPSSTVTGERLTIAILQRRISCVEPGMDPDIQALRDHALTIMNDFFRGSGSMVSAAQQTAIETVWQRQTGGGAGALSLEHAYPLLFDFRLQVRFFGNLPPPSFGDGNDNSLSTLRLLLATAMRCRSSTNC